MKYIIKQSQMAALRKALAKIEKAGPEEIIGLTEAEWEAYHNQSQVWEDSKAVPEKVDRTLLKDVPEPEKPKGMIRLIRRRLDNPEVWHASAWSQDIPYNRRDLEAAADKCNKDPLSNTFYNYQVEEREAQDGEEY